MILKITFLLIAQVSFLVHATTTKSMKYELIAVEVSSFISMETTNLGTQG